MKGSWSISTFKEFLNKKKYKDFIWCCVVYLAYPLVLLSFKSSLLSLSRSALFLFPLLLIDEKMYSIQSLAGSSIFWQLLCGVFSQPPSLEDFSALSSSLLGSSLTWVFIPLFPPFTGRVGGAPPLLLVQFLWSLKSSQRGQVSRLLLSILSRHLLSCLQSFPTLKIFSNILTAPLRSFWFSFFSVLPTSSSSLTLSSLTTPCSFF